MKQRRLDIEEALTISEKTGSTCRGWALVPPETARELLGFDGKREMMSGHTVKIRLTETGRCYEFKQFGSQCRARRADWEV